MSSSAYSAELRTDPALRRLVFGSGFFLALLGTFIGATLPFSPGARAGAVVLWVAWVGRELSHLYGKWSAYRLIRVTADGSVRLCTCDGTWHEAQLLPGSILLSDWGWIRLSTKGGRPFAEPLRQACQKRHDWRRLQVIWRHIGASG